MLFVMVSSVMAGKSRIVNHVEVRPVTAGKAWTLGRDEFRCVKARFGRQGGHVADDELSLGRYGMLMLCRG